MKSKLSGEMHQSMGSGEHAGYMTADQLMIQKHYEHMRNQGETVKNSFDDASRRQGSPGRQTVSNLNRVMGGSHTRGASESYSVTSPNYQSRQNL